MACGGYNKRFKTSVILTVKELDCDGFVVENLTFIKTCRDRFRNIMYKASCEELCLGIVNLAHELMGKRLLKAEVRVFNLTGYTEVFWNAGDQIPPFPRRASNDEVSETEKEIRREKRKKRARSKSRPK